MKMNWQYLQEIFVTTDVDTVVGTYRAWLETASVSHEQKEAIKLIHDALVLSSHILREDKSALAHQLVGRLMIYGSNNSHIKALIDEIIKLPRHLFPINFEDDTPVLLQAGQGLVRLFRHPTSVEGVMQTRDGRFITWCYDFNLYLWDKDGVLLKVMDGHRAVENATDEIYGVVELDDGRFLSLGIGAVQYPAVMCLWNADGAFLHVLTEHEKNTTFKAVIEQAYPFEDFLTTHDGQYLVTWHRHHVYFWHINTQPQYHRHRREGIGHVFLTKSGHVVTCHMNVDNRLKRWDLQGNLLKTYEGHTHSISNVIHTKADQFLSWSFDRTVCLWDAEGNLLNTFISDTRIWNIIETREGNFIVLANDWRKEKVLQLWNANGHFIKTLQGDFDSVAHVIQTQKGDYWAWTRHYESTTESMYVWSAAGQILKTLPVHGAGWGSLIELADGRVLFCQHNAESRFYLWDAEGNLHKHMLGISHANPLHTGKFFLQDKKGFHLYNTMLDKEHTIMRLSDDQLIYGYEVIALPDGRFIIHNHNYFLLWDDNWYLLSHIKTSLYDDKSLLWAWAQKNVFDPMIFYPNDAVLGEYRLSAYWDWKIEIYDPHTGQTIHTFYADSQFSCHPIIIEHDDSYVIVIADRSGGILFLRWNR